MSPTSPGAGVDPRAGGLLRTVAAAFAAFALVAVTLSTTLTYLGSRSTLLASQGERLAQFAAYSGLSLSLSGSDPAEDVALWLDMPDVVSPEITCEDHVRAFQEASTPTTPASRPSTPRPTRRRTRCSTSCTGSRRPTTASTSPTTTTSSSIGSTA